MKNDKTIELPGSGTLTRRQMVKVLASVGVGAAASPLMSPLAAAAEIGNKNGTRMVAAIFFESYATIAFRRALEYAGDDGFVASLPQLLHARANALLRQHHLEHLVHRELRGKRSHHTAGKSCRGDGPWWRHIRLAGTIREEPPCGPEPIQSGGPHRAICRQDFRAGSPRRAGGQAARRQRDPGLSVRRVQAG